MKFRLIVFVAVLAAGWFTGGWAGFFCGWIFLGIVGMIFPYRPKPNEIQDRQEAVWERVEHARRGSEVDPTRPHDDHPLLLTHEVRRQR